MSVIVRTDLEFVRERLKSPFGFKGRYLDELWQTVALIATDRYTAAAPATESVLWSDGAVFGENPPAAANALMMTYVIRFNSEEVPPKMGTFPQYGYPHTRARYAEVADYIGIKGKDDAEKVENLIKEIEVLKKKIGIKGSIKEYGIDEKDFLDRLDEMSVQAFDDQCTGANPRYPLISEIKEMYLKAYYGE